MAKGLRSSSKKSNRTKLRSRVFQPVENARLERIHAKLLETAQQEKPENPKKNDMEIDSADDADVSKEDELPKDMDVDGAAAPAKSKPKDRKAIRKAKKIKRTKPKNAIEFPKTRGKGALKPFSGSRSRRV